MVSLVRTPTHFFLALKMDSSFSPVPLKLRGLKLSCPILTSFSGTKRKGIYGFLDPRRRGRGWRREVSDSCWCYGGSASTAGDAELEARILEFMQNSKKPGSFPTRKELEDAGRFDLVEDIKRRGGWFSLGWDSDNDGNNEGFDIDFDMEEFARRVDICRHSGAFVDIEVDSLGSNVSSESLSSSGRSLEAEAEEESGIEGILRRLEKHRQSTFSICPEKSGNGKWPLSKTGRDDMDMMTTDVGSSNLKDTDTFVSDSWRTWSTRRAGFHDSEFDPDEINFGHRNNDDTAVVIEKSVEDLQRQNGVTQNDIRASLRNLKVELNSALEFMKFKNQEFSSNEDMRGSHSDLEKLSDALEFNENQFMYAQNILRSIRAKLNVLEGKMTLSVSDAQKMMEKKQSRIDGFHIAMQLLRTVHIVWPNSASEVLVAGSFDSWTSKRKMEKSSSGIFSLTLMLYPGRYEIKFIVDGKWRVDPLRPIVHNHGHENNLLFIT
ncbi:unnamed protein product [Cuscuta europaea]|uniref:AMP-activated protein kinase glycogen-binding domain-containing protein n=1 Tax=Cuscuta europaea TaxID=41803 RepID=A0A9P0ZV30_CUSEU|nr:unnamed protein product [Cuscuta europaea]